MSRTRTMITQELKKKREQERSEFSSNGNVIFHNKSVCIKRKLFESYGYLVSILENDR